MGENIFSALAKYGSRESENYLTEAFVFLLKNLLERDRKTAVRILDMLCGRDDEFCFDPEQTIIISTQKTTEEGRPDIEILAPNKRIYVEVKYDATLGYRQIDRYRKALEAHPEKNKCIVLLTRFAVELEGDAKPDKHVRLFEVYNWLVEAEVEDPVSEYLVRAFMDYLEEKQMSIQKVGWEYINGVPALTNLMNMIQVAIESPSLPIYQKTAGWDWKGFYIMDGDHFCGIYYERPLTVVFEIQHKGRYDLERLVEARYPVEEGQHSISFLLDLESTHFFSLNKDEQLELITTFLRASLDDAQEARIGEIEVTQSEEE
jgi:hypothetical protein